ncbi:MAG: hypothetical protein GXP55_13950 [Deltaproteobacteria bacterium]|nr:hypothetical protein [Deltaproteobacteria bacterium]
MTRRSTAWVRSWLLIAGLLVPTTPLAAQSADAAMDAGWLDAGAQADASADADDAAQADAGEALNDAAQTDAGEALNDAQDAPELPAEHRPRLTTTLTPTDGLVTGDALTLEIRADVPLEDDVAVPEQSFAPFEILEKHRRVEQGTGGRHTFVFQLRLIVLAPGDVTLTAVKLRVVTGGGVIGHVETRSFQLHVGSALGNEPHAEPKPPTEPVSLMVEDYTLAWLAGGLLALVLIVLLTLLAARWWRKREREAAPPPPPRPPWELAIARLESLRGGRAKALEEERGEEWIDGLSDAMRDYLGARYGFDGLESTTDEIIQRLLALNPVGLSAHEIAAVLGECDLIKFARADVDAEQMDRLLSEAFRMVRASMPQRRDPVGSAAAVRTPERYANDAMDDATDEPNSARQTEETAQGTEVADSPQAPTSAETEEVAESEQAPTSAETEEVAESAAPEDPKS